MAELSVLEELVLFLKPSTRPELRIAALRHVSGLTAEETGVSYILQHRDLLLCILTLLKDEVLESAVLAYRTLINVTATEGGAGHIVEEFDVMMELVSEICDPKSATADEASKLLTNLTRSESGSSEFLKKCKGSTSRKSDRHTPFITILIDTFCNVGYNIHGLGLDYLAYVVANITQMAEGREAIMNNDKKAIKQLLPFLKHESLIRRKGVANTIKNCCFEYGYHEKLLDDDLELLPQLLLPLAGPEEFDDEENDKLPLDLQYLPEDKKRESDYIVRKTLLEILLLLCAGKLGRNFQKSSGVYYIIRELHSWELDNGLQENADQCEKLIQLLIADEPHPDMENLMEIPKEELEEFERKLET